MREDWPASTTNCSGMAPSKLVCHRAATLSISFESFFICLEHNKDSNSTRLIVKQSSTLSSWGMVKAMLNLHRLEFKINRKRSKSTQLLLGIITITYYSHTKKTTGKGAIRGVPK